MNHELSIKANGINIGYGPKNSNEKKGTIISFVTGLFHRVKSPDNNRNEKNQLDFPYYEKGGRDYLKSFTVGKNSYRNIS